MQPQHSQTTKSHFLLNDLLNLWVFKNKTQKTTNPMTLYCKYRIKKVVLGETVGCTVGSTVGSPHTRSSREFEVRDPKNIHLL